MVLGRAQRWRFAIGASLVLIGSVGRVVPAHASEAPSVVRAAIGPSAAELRDKVLALQPELADVEARTAETERLLMDLQTRSSAVDHELGAADEAQRAARTELSRYAVAAYVSGQTKPQELTVALLTTDVADIDVEGDRVLATSVHTTLVGRARDATNRVVDAEQDRSQVDAERADLEARGAELTARAASLRTELATAQVDAERARLAEEAEAAERRRAEETAAREAQQRADEDAARAGTPRPTSVHSGVVPSPTVRAEIIAIMGGQVPRIALDAYYRAAVLTNRSMPGCAIDWALIGAIGRVETNHGTFGGAVVAPDGSTAPTILGIPLDGRSGTARITDTDGGALDGDPVYDRAVGPMQFIPGTWKAFAVDGNGDGIADPHNLYDAAGATGRYLCSTSGGPVSIAENASRAVYAYNRSAEYNAQVLTLADHYRRTIDPTLPPPTTPPTVPTDPGDLPPPASPPGTPPQTPDPTGPTTTTTTPVPTSAPVTSTTTTTPP